MRTGNPIAGGIGSLIRQWLQSVPFVHGSTGWRISRNGDVEFNSGVFRGNLSASSLSGTSIGTSSFNGGTINQSTIVEPTITFDSGGGLLLLYATTTVVTTFNASGTFAVPAAVTSIKAECVGAGAGGYNSAIGGPGGGAGEYAAELTLTVTPLETLTITVGTGGSGGTIGQSPGIGGDTTVKRSTTALVTAHGGRFGGGNNNPAFGGQGSTNTVHFNGGGSPAQNIGTTNGGCGGGGSGGSMQAGNSGAANSGNNGGLGGAAVTGGGAGGNGGSGSGPGTAGATGGAPGGGGGSGGFGTGVNNGQDGGAGAAGRVTITYVSAQTLIGAIAPTSGTDSLGNPYPQGYSLFGTTAMQWGPAGGAADVSLSRSTGKALQASYTPSGLAQISGPVLVDDVWAALTLKAGFTADPGTYTPSYSVRSPTAVKLSGVILKSGGFATGDVPFQMPSGLNPAEAQFWTCAGASNSAGNTVRLEIDGSGNATVVFNTTGYSTTFVSLDGVEVRLA